MKIIYLIEGCKTKQNCLSFLLHVVVVDVRDVTLRTFKKNCISKSNGISIFPENLDDGPKVQILRKSKKNDCRTSVC